jgi:ketosteroid isomerase-like protein
LQAFYTEAISISEQNVELARQAAEALSAGDLDGYFNYFDRDVVYYTRTDEPDAGVYHGLEEFKSFFVTSWLEMLRDFRADLDEVIDIGDQTISVAVVHGRGSTSGVEVAEPYVFLRTWHDGKTIEVVSTEPSRRPSTPWGGRGRRCRRSAHDDPMGPHPDR